MCIVCTVYKKGTQRGTDRTSRMKVIPLELLAKSCADFKFCMIQRLQIQHKDDLRRNSQMTDSTTSREIQKTELRQDLILKYRTPPKDQKTRLKKVKHFCFALYN